jgi:hypothetical protein
LLYWEGPYSNPYLSFAPPPPPPQPGPEIWHPFHSKE